MSLEYPDVTVNHLLVDACSMHLITYQHNLTSLLQKIYLVIFLSDEASVIQDL